MANDGINKRDDGSWELDAAAFIPEPNGYLKISGESYPIYSFLDIPVEDSMRIVKLTDSINDTSDYTERMRLSIEHLLLLNAGPDSGRGNRKLLTAKDLNGLVPRQIISLVVMANSIAAVPQKADTNDEAKQSEYPSSAPVSADSTVGVTLK